MPRSFLSPADSEAFRKQLAVTRSEKEWSLRDVAANLGCSRKTAWNHLRRGCKAAVRDDYAENLAKHVEGEVPWRPAARPLSGVNALRKAWQEAAGPAQRRRVAWRIAAFVSEYAVVSYDLPNVVSLSVSSAREPVTMSAMASVKNTAILGTLIIHFDCRRRDSLELLFCNPKGDVTFRGKLSAAVLPKMFNKIKSWQKAQH